MSSTDTERDHNLLMLCLTPEGPDFRGFSLGEKETGKGYLKQMRLKEGSTYTTTKSSLYHVVDSHTSDTGLTSQTQYRE